MGKLLDRMYLFAKNKDVDDDIGDHDDDQDDDAKSGA